MTKLQISAHARTRMQQRGIPEQVLPVLMKFGKCEYDHRGGKIVFLTKNGRDKVRCTTDKTLLKRLEPVLDVYAVLNVHGGIILNKEGWVDVNDLLEKAAHWHWA